MNRLFLFCFILVCFSACKKLDTYPVVPTLEYKSVDFSENSLGKTFTLNLTLTDGDGDVGYKTDASNGEFDNPDSSNLYYYNFVLKLQYLDNQVWKEYKTIVPVQGVSDTLPFNISTRIPYLTPDGKNKAIKAEIHKTDNLPDKTFMPEALLYFADTIRFTAFVYDRAKNKSNVIVTPAFYFDSR